MPTDSDAAATAAQSAARSAAAFDAPSSAQSASEARLRAILERVPVSIVEEDWSEARSLLADLRARGVSDGPAYFDAHPEFVHACLKAVRVRRRNAQAQAWEAARGQRGDDSLASVFDSPRSLAWFVDELHAIWAGQTIYTARRTQRGTNGEPATLQVTVALPDMQGSGDATALVSVTDVTELERLNAQLDASLRHLMVANQELETFTYSVSHDLKAPLRGIDAYSRLLLQHHEERLDPEGRQFLAYIRKATHQMAELIEDLLAYTRMERAPLDVGPIALRPLLEEVLADVQDAHPDRTIELALDVPAPCQIDGDMQALTMALRNLLDNAVKFARPDHPAQVAIRAAAESGMMHITVQDHGVGFDMKYHDRIFEIFQRLHRAEDYPGTGVGLAIVRKAVERMGGRVNATSAPGQGATFHMLLPQHGP